MTIKIASQLATESFIGETQDAAQEMREELEIERNSNLFWQILSIPLIGLCSSIVCAIILFALK